MSHNSAYNHITLRYKMSHNSVETAYNHVTLRYKISHNLAETAYNHVTFEVSWNKACKMGSMLLLYAWHLGFCCCGYLQTWHGIWVFVAVDIYMHIYHTLTTTVKRVFYCLLSIKICSSHCLSARTRSRR